MKTVKTAAKKRPIVKVRVVRKFGAGTTPAGCVACFASHLSYVCVTTP